MTKFNTDITALNNTRNALTGKTKAIFTRIIRKVEDETRTYDLTPLEYKTLVRFYPNITAKVLSIREVAIRALPKAKFDTIMEDTLGIFNLLHEELTDKYGEAK